MRNGDIQGRKNDFFARSNTRTEAGSVGNKKGNLNKDCLKSHSVPETGIEPAHSCERQILSLLRLPIPPPGQAGCNITTSLSIALLYDEDIFSENNTPSLSASLFQGFRHLYRLL